MKDFIIYHNPRCSKSRETLKLLRDQGIEPQVIEYLNQPLSIKELKSVLLKLNMATDELVRKKEADFKALGLKEASEQKLLESMISHPKLIERPIVIRGNKAVLGRPPENIFSLID